MSGRVGLRESSAITVPRCCFLIIFSPTCFFAHNQHIQMDSKNRKQLELLVGRAQPHIEEVTPQLIRLIKNKPTFLSAWNFAAQLSELEPKQIYGPLQIDPSHWTKITNGAASPPADERFVQFMDVVGNDIPLIWIAEKRGWDWTTIRSHRSDLERENEALKKELDDHKRAVRLLVEAKGAG
jgi:hypothetical protein